VAVIVSRFSANMCGKVVSCDITSIELSNEYEENCTVWGLKIELDDGRKVSASDLGTSFTQVDKLRKLLQNEDLSPNSFREIAEDFVDSQELYEI